MKKVVISNGIYNHIKKRAEEEHVELPKKNEMRDCLFQALDFVELDVLITYGKIKKHGVNYPDMENIGILRWYNINPEWAYIVVTQYDDAAKNAFRLTFGHELTHREDYRISLLNYVKFRPNQSDRILVRWCNEVHADFGGVVKFGGGLKKNLIDAIQYKIDYDDKCKYINNDTTYHPCWLKRRKYAEIGRFDRTLIMQIAADAGCNNYKLIDDLCNYFRDNDINLM